MKNYQLRAICLMVLAITTSFVVANDYLKIYFKDGHTERHYMKLVESISASKYDLDGNLHSDYQIQQIVMADTTYSYYLADIDSMAFRKVYEEQVNARVESVENSVMPIFQQSPTIEDMEARIEEIKAIEGVEDVWREGENIILQVRDWYKVFFTYPILPINSNNSLNLSRSMMNMHQLVPVKENGLPIKVVIAFQMSDDPRFDEHGEQLKELYDELKYMGFEVDSVLGGNLDVDFYKERMFDYDIVLVQTHGSFDGWKHSFFTGTKSRLLYVVLYPSDPLDIFDFDDIRYGSCKTDANSDGYEVYKMVSEDFIKKSKYKFKGVGPHIVYMAACSSLEGYDLLTHEHNGKPESFIGSDAVAKIFFNKGADTYMGYDKSSAGLGFTAHTYFNNMLRGYSQEAAFDILDENEYKHETRTDIKASLIDLVNNNTKTKTKSFFFYKVQTEEKTMQENESEYRNNGQLELKGNTFTYEIDPGIHFGFRIGTEQNVDQLTTYNEVESNNVHKTGNKYSEVAFSATYTPTPGVTYYYRAFTYDGIHYNWGEEKIFKVEQAVDADIITFADSEVKAICVKNWDTNKDGELSKQEAAAVKDLGTAFKNKTRIKTFDELQYFTGLTSIGDSAFYHSSITTLTIPNSVTNIGYRAFSHSSLVSIIIPNTVTSIEEGVFSWCSALTSITLPNSITSIAQAVFSCCSALTSITLPNSITSIGDAAFYSSGLTSITIPNSVESIGDMVFMGCEKLTSVTIPSSVTNIGECVFGYCGSLTRLKVESGNPVYDSREDCNAIIHTATNTIISGCNTTVFPNSVTTIGNVAFYGFTQSSITIPNSIIYIGSEAFESSFLTSITLPNSVKSIGYGTFWYCSELTSVTIPNSIEFIGSYAFCNCISLPSVTIPNSVKCIEAGAFYNCEKMAEVRSLIEEPFSIESWVFTNIPANATLYVPAGTKAKYEATEGWNVFSKIVEM